MIGALKKRELLDYLLQNKNVTVQDIVDATTITSKSDAHKYINKLIRSHGFKIKRQKKIKRLAHSATHIVHFTLNGRHKAKAESISLTELANQTDRRRLIERISKLAHEGYNIEEIATQCDETKSIIGHICRQNKIPVTHAFGERGPLKISNIDKLTIYRPFSLSGRYL